MDELTVKEIAERLKIPMDTAKSRLRLAGIEPVRKVGRTNIYNPRVVDQIRTFNPVGRPKKQPEPNPAGAKKAKGKK